MDNNILVWFLPPENGAAGYTWNVNGMEHYFEPSGKHYHDWLLELGERGYRARYFHANGTTIPLSYYEIRKME